MLWVYIFKYILFDLYEAWSSTDVVACVLLNIGTTNSRLSCSKWWKGLCHRCNHGLSLNDKGSRETLGMRLT